MSTKNIDNNKRLSTLFKILDNENQIMQRTDQKATTLLSILGVFMVFFIVHFLKLQMNWLIFLTVIVYFLAAFFTMINLILVISPRIKSEKIEDVDTTKGNPLFFAGISKYPNSTEYSNHLASITSDDEKIYKLFGNQVFALGTINLYKFKHMNRAIISFIIAISSELIIIIAMAWARAIPFLVQKFPNLNNFIN
tara:strand:- start:136 stop:720 length:585 start_codon:yes stop_codon:yes gene_type:complete